MLNLDESLVTFLMVLKFFDDEFVNSTFKNFLNGETKIADQKLNLKVNLGEIRYLGVPDIIDYRSKFVI